MITLKEYEQIRKRKTREVRKKIEPENKITKQK